MTIIPFTILCGVAFPSFANVPATRAEREDLVDARLRQLPLGDSAHALVRRSSWWAALTVSGLVTMDPAARRAAFTRAAWLERELATFLKKYQLRYTLTGEELRAYVEAGRAPGLTLRSSVDAVPLSDPTRRALASAGCRTLGDVRARLLEAILYGVAPLDPPRARELAELRHARLTEGAVITPGEYEFAEVLSEARLGQSARRLLRESGVRTLADLRALPLDQIAARGQIEKKVVKQVRALFYGRCGTRLLTKP